MANSTASSESLKLQINRHQADIKIIRQKQKVRILLKNKKNNDSFTSTQTIQELKEKQTILGTDVNGIKDEVDGNLLVHRTMEECDSLLAFLRKRSEAGGKSLDPLASIVQKALKSPKDDKTIIEELRVHNDALRFHVLSLLEENEEYEQQIRVLELENDNLRGTSSNLWTSPEDTSRLSPKMASSGLIESSESDKSEKYYPNPNRIDVNDLPKLPPLEKPQFDMESFDKMIKGEEKK